METIFLLGLESYSPSKSKIKVCSAVREKLAIERNFENGHFDVFPSMVGRVSRSFGRALIAPEPQGDPKKNPLTPKIGVTEHLSKKVFFLLNRKLLPLKIAALDYVKKNFTFSPLFPPAERYL